MRRIVERYLRPIEQQLVGTLREGMARGEIRKLDPLHLLLSMVAMNVFYFGSAPVIAIVTGSDPLAPEMVAARRAAVLDVLAAALSVDLSEEGKSK
jgi:hypothetical protein